MHPRPRQIGINKITQEVIGAAIAVHRALGPGLLESAYQECLCQELALGGIPFERQVPLPLEYRGIRLECGYRLDILVSSAVVVEVKSIEAIAPIHEAQLLTLSAARRLECWPTDELQCGCVKGRHQAKGTWPERVILCASSAFSASLR